MIGPNSHWAAMIIVFAIQGFDIRLGLEKMIFSRYIFLKKVYEHLG